MIDFDDLDDFESDDEYAQRRHQEKIAAKKQAEIEAGEIDWFKSKTHLKDALVNLGGVIGDEYANIFCASLDGEITANCRNKAMRAERLLWIAEREAELCNNQFSGSFQSISDAFFNHLDLLTQTGANQIEGFDKWYCPMLSISLVFFNQADSLMQESKVTEALDRVAEAFLAKGYYDYMLWHEIGGEDATREEKIRAAKKRHAPTYALKNKIVDYWRNNISADKSNEFAAELLQKQFPEVSHRTLAGYVAEAKKIPPAGTL